MFLFVLFILVRQVIGINFPNTTINTNYTFFAANSPYYIDKTLHFFSNVKIENGVEIIFTTTKIFIQIYGNIDCGCSNIGTLNNQQRGLIDSTTYVHIHSDNATFNSYSFDLYDIYFDSYHSFNNIRINNTEPKLTRFCNTKFDSLFSGIHIVNPYMSNIMIDNCIFNNIYHSVFYSEFESQNDSLPNQTPNSSKPSLFINNSILKNVYIIQTNHFSQTEYNNMDIQYKYSFCGSDCSLWRSPTRLLCMHGYPACYDKLKLINSTLLISSQSNAFRIASGSNSIIYNNTITGNSGVGIVSGLETNRSRSVIYISGNIFKNINARYALSTSTKSPVYIINNTFTDNNTTESVIRCWYDCNTNIENNLFINNHNGWDVIALVSRTDDMLHIYNANIKNNSFTNNTMRGKVIYISGTPYSVNIDGNLFQNNIYQHNLIYANVYQLYLMSNIFRGNNLIIGNYRGKSQFLIATHHLTMNQNIFYNQTVLFYRSKDNEHSLRSFTMMYNIFYNAFDLHINTGSLYNMHYNNFYNGFITNVCSTNLNATLNYFDAIIDGNDILLKIYADCDCDVIDFIPFYTEPIDFDNVSYSNLNYYGDFINCFTSTIQPETTEYITQENTEYTPDITINSIELSTDSTEQSVITTMDTNYGQGTMNRINVIIMILSVFLCIN